MARLTRTLVQETPAPGSGDRKLWDDEVKGFGAVITAKGARTWVVRYRTLTGRPRQMRIGQVAAISADRARQIAARTIAEALVGSDPVEAKRAARSAGPPEAPLTLGEFAERFFEEHCARKKSADEDRRKLDVLIIPKLGHLPLAEIGPAVVQELHTEIGRDRPVLANRTRALLSSLFEHAERLDLRTPGSNPVRRVTKFREQGRERFLSESEFARFAAGLERAVLEAPSRAFGAAAIRLLCLTGCRRNEILERRWDDYDAERQILRLTDSKTGPRDVRLGAPAVQLLEELPRKSEWIFPSVRGEGRITDIRKLIERACELADPPVKVFRPHDLRHSFASLSLRGGMGLSLIGSLLGHRKVETTARYAHLADDAIQQAAEIAQGAMDRALNPAQPSASVVPIRKK